MKIAYVLCSALLVIANTFAQSVKFTIFTFNDVYEIVPNKEGVGGLAELATLLDRERMMVTHHVTTMNGDFLSPSLLSTFDHGEHNVEIFDELGVDLLCIGNHEFDFGPDLVREKMGKKRKFVWLGANVFNSDDSYFSPDPQTYIYTIDDVKIGFFGLCTNDTPTLSAPGKDIKFKPIAETARIMVQKLKEEGADVIVALTHLLFHEDRKLAKEVPGINLILGGHDHEPISWYEGRTLIHKSGFNAWFLGRIDLLIEKKEGRTKVFPSWHVILNRHTDPKPNVLSIIRGYEQKFTLKASDPIAVIETPLDSRIEVLRTQESFFGNLLADAVFSSAKGDADAALLCSGALRGNYLYEKGETLSLIDLMEELPFGNMNVVLEMNGEDIVAALENGVSLVEAKAGRFPLVSGIEFSYDISEPPGRRIKMVNIQGMPIVPYKRYRIATIDYLWQGGDGYTMFRKGQDLTHPDKKIKTIEALVNHIKKMGICQLDTRKRITCYGELIN